MRKFEVGDLVEMTAWAKKLFKTAYCHGEIRKVERDRISVKRYSIEKGNYGGHESTWWSKEHWKKFF
jgi:hypothetical protein